MIVTSSPCPIRFTLEIIIMEKYSPVVDGANVPSVRLTVIGSSSSGAIISNALLMVKKAPSSCVPKLSSSPPGATHTSSVIEQRSPTP
jgi:hypothetical protein